MKRQNKPTSRQINRETTDRPLKPNGLIASVRTTSKHGLSAGPAPLDPQPAQNPDLSDTDSGTEPPGIENGAQSHTPPAGEGV